MYMKLPFRDLNLDPYPLHYTSTYTCGGDHRTKGVRRYEGFLEYIR